MFLEIKKFLFPCKENNFRPKLLENNLLIYFITALLLFHIIFLPFLYLFPKTGFFAEISKSILVNLTNKERESLDLNRLEMDKKLEKAAFLKAKHMLKNDYFSHYSPQGVTPWHWFKEVGYNYEKAGENLAIGFIDSEEIYTAWENSPSHFSNLVNPIYEEIGISVVKGDYKGNEVFVVVQLFGSSAKVRKTEKKNKTTSGQEVAKKEETSTKETKESEEETQKEENIKERTGIVLKSSTSSKVKGTSEENKLTKDIFKFISSHYLGVIDKITIFFAAVVFSLLASMMLVEVYVGKYEDMGKITACFLLLIFLVVVVDKQIFIELIPHNLDIATPLLIR